MVTKSACARLCLTQAPGWALPASGHQHHSQTYETKEGCHTAAQGGGEDPCLCQHGGGLGVTLPAIVTGKLRTGKLLTGNLRIPSRPPLPRYRPIRGETANGQSFVTGKPPANGQQKSAQAAAIGEVEHLSVQEAVQRGPLLPQGGICTYGFSEERLFEEPLRPVGKGDVWMPESSKGRKQNPASAKNACGSHVPRLSSSRLHRPNHFG